MRTSGRSPTSPRRSIARRPGSRSSTPAFPTGTITALDFLAGVPLVSSADAAVDLEPGGRMAAALLERLASGTSSGQLATETRALDTELRREPQVSRRIADFLLGDETLTPPFPGLLRYVAWTAMARFLRPVVNAFDGWRDEDRWLRRYCPTCGSLPAMAQLVGADPGRKRLLSCGCCGTRWQFKRTGCPFCETDDQRLASMTIEGERGLRIDHCEACGGYLKTYDGEGNESCPARRLDVTPSRHPRPRSWTQTAGGIALRPLG